ncbi:MAG: Trk system potassium transporter TrkA [Proteobacteria bacterium]|jgi:trk system potassium uptake protein|nr:Trk system potassium transporter TrkA [Pseudomonadota bacterium]
MEKNENILILGLGGIGFYLAKRLSRDEYPTTVIESNSELIRRAEGELDARLILGDAMSFNSWREAKAEAMDHLIAVTDNDAANIMAVQIADKCGIARKIARVRTLEIWEPESILSQDDLKIDLVIRPEELAAREIVRLLKMRSGKVVIDIGDSEMHVVATRIDKASSMSLTSLKDIAQKHNDFDFRIVSIARGLDTIIPTGDHTLRPGDHIFVLAHNKDISRLMRLVGASENNRHRVLIIGGGMIGTRVAQLLQSSFPIRLLETDVHQAEALTHLIPQAEVLHGDGSDSKTLLQAGLLNMDTVITATNNSETNIMTSFLVKHLQANKGSKAGKTICLVRREEYLVLASSMGIDVVLNKKVLAANEILKHLRRGKLLALAHLHGCDAEVVELMAEANSPITRQPLLKLTCLREKIIIGGFFRSGQWQTAVGDTQIQGGDKVIGICRSHHLHELQRQFLS